MVSFAKKLPGMRKVSIALAVLGMHFAGTAREMVRIACIGNSITEGTLLPNPAADSWPRKLGELLGADYDVKNFGRTTTTMLRKGDLPYVERDQFPRVFDFSPHWAVITLGTNDTKPENFKYADEFAADTEYLIDSLKTIPTLEKIWLCTPVPVFKTTWGINEENLELKILPSIEQSAGALGAGLVDLHESFLAMTAEGWERYYLDDGVHPSPLGQDSIARIIFASLTAPEPVGVFQAMGGMPPKVPAAGSNPLWRAIPFLDNRDARGRVRAHLIGGGE